MNITSKIFIYFIITIRLTMLSIAAQAETTNCKTISVIPTTINSPGIYCFKSNLNSNIANGSAITIAANDVVIDLNGYKLNGCASGASALSSGISSQFRRNITVKNGTIEGYMIGISLAGFRSPSEGEGNIVEDIRAVRNFQIGIDVQGNGIIVRNNYVASTGGSTAFGKIPLAGLGIGAHGKGARVLNNDIVSTKRGKQGTSTGISLQGFVDNTDGLAVNNRITGADVGIIFQDGSSKFRDNLTSDVKTPYVSGTDAGNNN